MEYKTYIFFFFFIIIRWILIIYLLNIILYKLLKKYFNINWYIYEYNIHLITHIGPIYSIIKEHMKLMDNFYYPLNYLKYKRYIYPYFNGFLIICIIILYIQTILEIFSKMHFDLLIYKQIIILLVTINISITLYFDLLYKYTFVDIYINTTKKLLNNKINNYLFCGDLPKDNPATPVDWKVRNLYGRAVTAGYPEQISKGMMRGSLFVAACSTCIMFLWGHHELYKEMLPHKIPPLVRGSIWFNPPETLQEWDAFVQKHPSVATHPKYIEAHKSLFVNIEPNKP